MYNPKPKLPKIKTPTIPRPLNNAPKAKGRALDIIKRMGAVKASA